MSRRARGYLAGLTFLLALGGGLAGFFLGGRKAPLGGAQEALSQVGRFRVGAELGEERAAFSGRPKLLVFASPEDGGWADLASCLTDPALSEDLSYFTPILVDERADLETERRLREENGLRVVARAKNGKYLGGLTAGFGCGELADLIAGIRANARLSLDRSPLYSVLVRDPSAIDAIAAESGIEAANRFADLLGELEGAGSPVVQEIEARLGR
jgi:hypothetical protein